jgi:hypothetical protein
MEQACTCKPIALSSFWQRCTSLAEWCKLQVQLDNQVTQLVFTLKGVYYYLRYLVYATDQRIHVWQKKRGCYAVLACDDIPHWSGVGVGQSFLEFGIWTP